MSFADVGEIAFANGPPWARRFSGLARVSIIVGLFAAYFATCSVYTVIIATNFQQVIEFYTGDDEATSGERIRLYIAALMIPLVLISWVPNLKKLAPISMVANAFMGVGLLITFYYLSIDLPSVAERAYVAPFEAMPQFFSITIFAMEAIGVVMPLENAMKTPQHFIGICGVLNQGMGGVTMIYIFLGFLGYLKYGAETKGSITLNLPIEDYAAQAVKILVGLAVFCTYGLQYFVCLEIVWNSLKDRFQKNSALAEYVVRTILTVAAVLLAVAVPTIGPFLGLIGALCFSLLGLIIPVFIEFVTYWEKGFGPGNWIVWKNILVLICGFLALVFGSYTSLLEIINVKDLPSPLETFTNESSLLGNETMTHLNATLQQLGEVVNSTLEAAVDKLT
ncbi:proton-coupled amino acid transporter-like protein pathetic [Nilaparvata lugens]|uniref:proton-coupled amino acid transporter-like protein pathetic n=1 Tax=Nilaparvata lugens TaxID=108931 RepID=UPI00193D81AA|nr:proton-coupled amino acid transporter-like protein pathetic [Nilaparvata lugens]